MVSCVLATVGCGVVYIGAPTSVTKTGIRFQTCAVAWRGICDLVAGDSLERGVEGDFGCEIQLHHWSFSRSDRLLGVQTDCTTQIVYAHISDIWRKMTEAVGQLQWTAVPCFCVLIAL